MNTIIIIIMAAHLGFVNGAVQCIVLLVIEQTELQGPQCSCKDGEKGGRKRRKLVAGKRSLQGAQSVSLGRVGIQPCCLLSSFERIILMGNIIVLWALTRNNNHNNQPSNVCNIRKNGNGSEFEYI